MATNPTELEQHGPPSLEALSFPDVTLSPLELSGHFWTYHGDLTGESGPVTVMQARLDDLDLGIDTDGQETQLLTVFFDASRHRDDKFLWQVSMAGQKGREIYDLEAAHPFSNGRRHSIDAQGRYRGTSDLTHDEIMSLTSFLKGAIYHPATAREMEAVRERMARDERALAQFCVEQCTRLSSNKFEKERKQHQERVDSSGLSKGKFYTPPSERPWQPPLLHIAK